ncbi:MAG: CBS domain-containing protein [Candidatus Aenigmatarchaeota archaeon]
MKIDDLTAKNVASKDYFSVSPDDEVRKILPRFQKEDIIAVPVLEDGKFKAIITWRKILRKSAPPRTKVSKLMHTTAKLQGDENMPDIAEKMLEIGERAMPVFEGDELVGMITQKEIIGAVAKDEEFSEKKVVEFCSEVVSIDEGENIGRARALMRENHFARLPIVDENGELAGSVDVSGIIKTFHAEKAMQLGEAKGDALPERESPVTAIMNHSPLTVDPDENLKDVAKKMIEKGSLYAIVVKDSKPIGIITPKDILELVAARKEEKGAYVQIAGARDLGEFEKTKILDLAERTVRKAGRIFRDVENLIVHIKQQNSEGSQTQYMVKARIFTSQGLFIAREDWNWELIDSVNNCLSTLEKRFTKEHEKNIDASRKRGS